jgi:hypothetical protein
MTAAAIPRSKGITGGRIFRFVNSGAGIGTSLSRGEPQHVRSLLLLGHAWQLFPLWRPKHLRPKEALAGSN